MASAARAPSAAKSAGAAAAERTIPSKASLRSSPSARAGRQWQAVVVAGGSCSLLWLLGLGRKADDGVRPPPAAAGQREAVLVTAAMAHAAGQPVAEWCGCGGFTMYEDEANKFSIAVPQGWLIGAGESSGIKSVTAFYPEQAADSNVSVAITGIGPDFTSLKSFGDVDAFAEGLVNGLDRSWQRPPGLAAKLVDSKAANGLYYVEYTLQNPGERRRHILSAIGMAFNGWYNRLYTVTGQYIDDEESEKYKPQIEKAVRSFRLT